MYLEYCRSRRRCWDVPQIALARSDDPIRRRERVIELQKMVAATESITSVFDGYISVIVVATWSEVADPIVMIL